MKTRLAALLALLALLFLRAGDFDVRRDASGHTRILYRGEVLVEGMESIIAAPLGTNLPRRPTLQIQRQETTLPDGGKAWNFWCEHPDTRFRFEIVLPAAADEVEITWLTEATARPKFPWRNFAVKIPWGRVAGTTWHGKTGRTPRVRDIQGTFSDSIRNGASIQKDASFRQIAIHDRTGARIVFDCNPLGLGDFLSDYSWNSIRGLWGAYRKDGFLSLEAGANFGLTGAHVGGKMRIYAGTNADFRKYHAQTKSGSGDDLVPERLYCFGAARHGANYTAMPIATAAPGKDGWVDVGAARAVGGKSPGVYYAAVAGKNGKFRLADLEPGLYILSFGIGNYDGAPNRFRILVDGEPITDFLSAAPRQALLVNRAVWLEKGAATIDLEGDFLLSALGVQALLHTREDYSFRRGIWAVDGFEPCVLYRNAHYRPDAPLKTSVAAFDLPVSGQETAAPRKPLDYPVALPPPGAMPWRYSARFSSLCSGNDSSLNEYTDPAELARRLDDLKSKHVNTVIVNGMLSRHTYPRHIGRAKAELKKIAAAAHARGMKVMDHQDLTLLWNIDSGYRVLCANLDEADRRLDDMLPTPHFCPVNPAHREKAYRYFIDFILETGIDALMIDEVAFWTHSCLCSACRAKFHADTGWHYPVNELDPRLKDATDPLWKAFREWRKREIGNWWVGLRRRLAPLKPDFSFVAYSTHYGFSANWAPLSLGLDLCQLARAVDFLGTEIMSRNVLESSRAVMSYRKMKNSLRRAFGAPIYGLVYPEGHWDLAYFGWALNNMNGQLTWERVGDCPPGKSDYHAFAPENMDLATARPAAEAALLFSCQSRDYNRGFGYRPELMGTAQTLEELHIPYDMINEFSLPPEGLRPFKLLYVGASGCLSDAQIQAILDFAKAGNTVILSPFAGIFDELGNTRPKWAFADLFGFGFRYGKFNTARCAVLYDADGAEIRLAAPVLYYRPDGFTGHRDCAFYADYGGAKYPLATVRPYGKGKVIYHHAALGANLAAAEHNPGDTYGFALDEALARCFRAILRDEFADASAGFATDAPATVYTSLYRQGGRHVIHLLNASGVTAKKGEVVRHGPPPAPFPPIAQDIHLSLRRGQVSSVYAVSPDFPGRQPLAFQMKDGECRITLPKALLKAYTLVFVQ